ncbi:MAG: hypothetical protein U0996_26715, partial [Planctomycetaceae bacterium]
LVFLAVIGIACGTHRPAFAQTALPDYRTVSADLTVPNAVDGPAVPGRRCLVSIPDSRWQIPYVLYLPDGWSPAQAWPVFVELPGNGGYRDALGDECTGLPQDCHMGYGLTEGKHWIWVCLPFLNGDGSKVSVQWWGDAPQHDPSETLRYWQAVLGDVTTRFAGKQDCVVLAGFSRGAIACNALGLHDDTTASLWTAFLPCSHYDGVRSWPFSGSDRENAVKRLHRLNRRSQFICGEGTQTDETRRYLGSTGVPLESLTISPTGFRNHSDQWTLRPCEARTKARTWLETVRTSR